MGKASRLRPKRLGEKLLAIRNSLNLSQTEMWKKLELEGTTSYTAISNYETGKREPSLLTILKYAELIGISTDVLIDDSKNLPTQIIKRLIS